MQGRLCDSSELDTVCIPAAERNFGRACTVWINHSPHYVQSDYQIFVGYLLTVRPI